MTYQSYVENGFPPVGFGTVSINDVFQFTYYAPNAGIKPAECQNVGLYPVSGVFGSSIKNSQCQLERTSYLENCAEGKKGTSCAGLIIKDGWKISKDYPWDYA